ncbi:HAD family phosphatase [Halobacteria archaeon AArc-curdl1]|uniref:phosphoserine phosphatase n=1 Tax=Natronosalvus hydrolyticus TaxID=2979988 RepID=A0AAP2Z4N8_9EURY|nr:HAD family phosphatase [Halobacteria archaeon AArc-curdl1]
MTLVAFDFDETLCQSDLSIALGREYDVENEMQGLRDQGVREEVDVETSLRHRVSLLEGMPMQQVETAFERCALREDAVEVLADLRRSDVPVAIVTRSFERGVEAVLDRADVAVDHLVANRLVVANDALTGEIEGPLVEGEKDQALVELAVAEETDLDRTFTVANGATDLPMLRTAGTAIGYDPEPVVEQYCDHVVTSMRKLHLYFDQHGIVDADGNER